MNNNVLKVIAALLALGAVIVAIIGIRLSGRPDAPATVAQTPAPTTITVPVVVASHDLAPGHMLTTADVTVQSMAQAPTGAHGQVQMVLGHTTSQALPKGAPILPAHIAPDSLAALLRTGERAVAMQMDEVVGLGGFAKPGDHVDVLQFAGPNRESQDTTYAQVLIRDARILTFGDATQLEPAAGTAAGSSASNAMPVQDHARAAVEARERRQGLRSAVLAVREADAPALMLAANTGTLRLALRPRASNPAADALPVTPEGNRLPVRVADIAPVKAKPAVPQVDAPAPIVIQEGSKERRLAQSPQPTQP